MQMRFIVAAAAAVTAAAATAQDIRVNTDQATAVRLEQAAKTVIIGNPLIAEVMLVDDRTVYVLGRMAGQTNLVAVDQNGAEIVNQKVSVKVGDQQMVTLHKGNMGPRTFSCAPKCEWVVMPGDEAYKTIQEDADKKQQQSDNASQIATKR
jgi:Flp pilus assembly secretin CpaC